MTVGSTTTASARASKRSWEFGMLGCNAHDIEGVPNASRVMSASRNGAKVA